MPPSRRDLEEGGGSKEDSPVPDITVAPPSSPLNQEVVIQKRYSNAELLSPRPRRSLDLGVLRYRSPSSEEDSDMNSDKKERPKSPAVKKGEVKKAENKGEVKEPEVKKDGAKVDDSFLRKPDSPPSNHPASGKLVAGGGGGLCRMRTPPLEKEPQSGKENASNLASPEPLQWKGRGRRESLEKGKSLQSDFATEFEQKRREVSKSGPRTKYGKLTPPERVVEKPRTLQMQPMGDFDPDEQDASKLPPPPPKQPLEKGKAKKKEPSDPKILPWNAWSQNEEQMKNMKDFEMDPLLPAASIEKWKEIRRSYRPKVLPHDTAGQYYSFPPLREDTDTKYVEQYLSGKALGGLREGNLAPIEKYAAKKRVASSDIGAVNNPAIKTDGSREKSEPTSPKIKSKRNSIDNQGFMQTLDANKKAREYNELSGRELAGATFPVLKKEGGEKSKDSEAAKSPTEQSTLGMIGSTLYSAIFKGKSSENDTASNTVLSVSPPPGFASIAPETIQAYIDGQLTDKAPPHFNVSGAGGSISGRSRRHNDEMFKTALFEFFVCRQTPHLVERHHGLTKATRDKLCRNLWQDMDEYGREKWAKFMKGVMEKGESYDDDYDSDVFDPDDLSGDELDEAMEQFNKLRITANHEFEETFMKQLKRGGPDMKILQPEERHGNLENWAYLDLPRSQFVVEYMRRSGVENPERWLEVSERYNKVLEEVVAEKKQQRRSEGKSAKPLTNVIEESSKGGPVVRTEAAKLNATTGNTTCDEPASSSKIPTARTETSSRSGGISALFKGGAENFKHSRSGSSGQAKK